MLRGRVRFLREATAKTQTLSIVVHFESDLNLKILDHFLFRRYMPEEKKQVRGFISLCDTLRHRMQQTYRTSSSLLNDTYPITPVDRFLLLSS